MKCKNVKEKEIRKDERAKINAEQMLKQDYAEFLANNQKRLYQMIMSLNQQIICLSMKIKQLERRVF